MLNIGYKEMYKEYNGSTDNKLQFPIDCFSGVTTAIAIPVDIIKFKQMCLNLPSYKFSLYANSLINWV
ncbi:hypothetical protein DXN04_25615 [Chitinophaga silvisoli]|uniref:Uncharacterized protein n=1 Tax=Chitinophaga silvisoli TaxID=2291814 RepID=A0A3E1NW52_9BACT|nr:hypothetical protein DXN04_25615 [Chitinophaga silvisoli]